MSVNASILLQVCLKNWRTDFGLRTKRHLDLSCPKAVLQENDYSMTIALDSNILLQSLKEFGKKMWNSGLQGITSP